MDLKESSGCEIHKEHRCTHMSVKKHTRFGEEGSRPKEQNKASVLITCNSMKNFNVPNIAPI